MEMRKSIMRRLQQLDQEFEMYDARHTVLISLAEENLKKMNEVTKTREEIVREFLQKNKPIYPKK